MQHQQNRSSLIGRRTQSDLTAEAVSIIVTPPRRSVPHISKLRTQSASDVGINRLSIAVTPPDVTLSENETPSTQPQHQREARSLPRLNLSNNKSTIPVPGPGRFLGEEKVSKLPSEGEGFAEDRQGSDESSPEFHAAKLIPGPPGSPPSSPDTPTIRNQYRYTPTRPSPNALSPPSPLSLPTRREIPPFPGNRLHPTRRSSADSNHSEPSSPSSRFKLDTTLGSSYNPGSPTSSPKQQFLTPPGSDDEDRRLTETEKLVQRLRSPTALPRVVQTRKEKVNKSSAQPNKSSQATMRIFGLQPNEDWPLLLDYARLALAMLSLLVLFISPTLFALLHPFNLFLDVTHEHFKEVLGRTKPEDASALFDNLTTRFVQPGLCVAVAVRYPIAAPVTMALVVLSIASNWVVTLWAMLDVARVRKFLFRSGKTHKLLRVFMQNTAFNRTVRFGSGLFLMLIHLGAAEPTASTETFSLCILSLLPFLCLTAVDVLRVVVSVDIWRSLGVSSLHKLKEF